MFEPRRRRSKASRSAADWLVRKEHGALSHSEQEDFDTWIEDRPENARAYQALERIWQEVEQLPSSQVAGASALEFDATGGFSTLPARKAAADRRPRWFSRLAMGSVLAAGVVLGIALWTNYGVLLRADAATGVGEVRTVSLPDGSSATLNTDTAIRFRFTPAERRVDVLSGEAYFAVAPDAKRPFLVQALGGTTRALGTEFLVRQSGGMVRVTDVVHPVSVHYVRMDHDAGEHDPPEFAITLQPGQQVRYSPRSGLGTPVSIDSANARAWTRAHLVFEDEPLGEVVAELNRYHHGLIRITQPRLAALKVSGVFPLGDPIGTVDKLERSLGVRSTRLTDYFVFIHD